MNVNTSPDIYLNRNTITFSKKVLEDLNYPANVQYTIPAEQRVFAIRACKSNEMRCVAFSKPRNEQTTTLSTGNKNLVDVIRALLPKGTKRDQRYKVTGFLDAETRTMYFDMDEATPDTFRQKRVKFL